MSESAIINDCLHHYTSQHIQLRKDFFDLCAYDPSKYNRRVNFNGKPIKDEPNQECMAKILRLLETLTDSARTEWAVKADALRKQGLNPQEPKEYPIQLSYGFIAQLLYFTHGDSPIRNSIAVLLERDYIKRYQETINSVPFYVLNIEVVQKALRLQAEQSLSGVEKNSQSGEKFRVLKKTAKPLNSTAKGARKTPERPNSTAKPLNSTPSNNSNTDQDIDKTEEEGTDGSANATPTPALVSHPEYGFLWFDDPVTPSHMVVRLTPEYPHPYHSPDEDKRRERIARWEVEPYLKARGLNVSVIFMHDLGNETTVEASPTPFSSKLSQFFDHAIESAQQAALSPIATDTPTHEENEHDDMAMAHDGLDRRQHADNLTAFGRQPLSAQDMRRTAENQRQSHENAQRAQQPHGRDERADQRLAPEAARTGAGQQETTPPVAASERVAPSAATPESGYENDEDCAPTEPRVRAVKPVREAQPEQQFSTGRNIYPQQSAKVEPKAEQDALIARPDKPEMPLPSARWCAETAVLVSEALRGKYYTEGQRQNQVNAAKRMFRDFTISRAQFEEIFADWAKWWKEHDMGIFTLAGLLARGKDREVRLQTALDKLEARANKAQQQTRGTVSGRPRLDAKPTNDNHMLYSDEELRAQSDIVWARMQARLASPEVQAKLAAKGIYQ